MCSPPFPPVWFRWIMVDVSDIAVARTVADLRTFVAAWRKSGEAVALVPTMGALHAGHLSLVERARTLARRVVVSVFVNPTQFGPNEDFDRYPRQEAVDAALLAKGGADLLFAPAVAEMYPEGASTTVHVAGLTECLCGPVRPGHFDGVATVVAKLLLQCLPDTAVFGEKDYQQLQVIRRMVRDLDIPVGIAGAPTMRDEFGLALSSRNAYLSPGELVAARRLNVVLKEVAATVADHPERRTAAEAQGREALFGAGFTSVDYLDVRDAETLVPWDDAQRPGRVLAAARLGVARLIDNFPVN